MYKKLLSVLLLSNLMFLPAVQAAIEKVEPESVTQSTQDHIQVVNINSASVEQLSLLRGIGDSKAKAIVDYRKTHGKFDSINQLSNVKGIGDKLIEQNKAVLSL
ncbi:competence protein ComEA [Shewanella sp. Choline-02u-19]|jgi:competence protein ComEA|uniref:ComEA family DNA-binding protein n=1 Tax=unclassified Shewanella TaxID=196818 RepID=UPI000C326872|nr:MULTISPECIES: helix-hairpin-helix domain-containing protein [unclassified Shewanella]PKG73502.1 competence protein ComEA [Shewanella sp. GutCb]PKH53671.1 competence protein ComEA [Shewanella sp. Bg11-22]PKI28099.1 competence protein ComEA [Shewanella sp. Choline-02u-19]